MKSNAVCRIQRHLVCVGEDSLLVQLDDSDNFLVKFMALMQSVYSSPKQLAYTDG